MVPICFFNSDSVELKQNLGTLNQARPFGYEYQITIINMLQNLKLLYDIRLE